MTGTTDRVDVAIAGAGFVGLALATLLSASGLRVVIADPRAGQDYRDPRASTLVSGVRRLLEAAGAWTDIAAGAEPVAAMDITDSRLDDALRPIFLTFGDSVDGEPFAHVVENEAIHRALAAAAGRAGVRFERARIVGIDRRSGLAVVTLDTGARIGAALVAAADGAASALREIAGIRRIGWRYDQSSIVTTVSHARPHEGRAVQHFLEGGPFALLPLKGQRSSVVWSERPLDAERLCALDDAAFLAELARRAGPVFGELALAGPRAHRRLALGVAERFAVDRIALAGDAAHSMHPLAGQGLNLGLKDVAALAELVVDAARLGQDIGSEAVLGAYERARRFDTMAMLGATDVLARLFGARSGAMRLARDTGLGMVDRLPGLKRGLTRQAAGLGGEPPRLMRGEAL